MDAERLKDTIREENPDALIADGFDAALVGFARRCGQPTLAVYDSRLVLECLQREGMSHSDAREWFEFNIVGAWMGEHTPLWLHLETDRG